MKRLCTLLTILFIGSAALAQTGEEESFRSSFNEGNALMEEFNYSVALDVWMDLIKNNPDNYNINYKVGVCLWKIPKRRGESLPYFQKAASGVSERYNPFTPTEKNAPVEAYFYISEAYHLNYELDSAIKYYNEFKNLINHNHEFWSRTDLNIEQCERAKKAILNPVDIEIINLGEMVNTKYPEYAPVLSVDESALYFTSKRLRSDSSNLYSKNPNDGEFYEDIYVSYKDENNAWGEPEQLNFNTASNEATLNLSADGETMFIYKAAKNNNGDLYYSTLEGENWSEPVLFGSDINSDAHETHVTVAPDGSRLYFISDRKGSMKFPDKAHNKVESRDIYFCNKLPTGDWALAQPLKELNTPYHEEGVFMHPDGKTMYFSSEGHESIGGYDIFYSELKEDESGMLTWGKPVNIGYPLNTTADDIFFITSASGKRGYYSSIRDEGYGDKDIYVISMLSFKEKPLTLLIGEIKAPEGQEVPDGIVVVVTDNESGETVGEYKPRARDKKFTVIIPPGSDYHMDYTYGDSIFHQDDIYVPSASSYQEIRKGISLGAVDFSKLPPPVKEEKAVSEPQAKSGSENPSIEGKLQYGAAGAAGVLLNLNEGDKKVASTTTDGSGNFEFNDLAAGTGYAIAIDGSNGNVPDNAQLYVRDKETGAILPVNKMADGTFGFETLPYMAGEELALEDEKDETSISGPKNPNVEGNLKYGGVAAAGVGLNLKDQGSVVEHTTTDNNGNFAFAGLEAGKNYSIGIEGDVPADAELSLKDQSTGTMLPVSKLADGTFGFETLPYIEPEEMETEEPVEDEVVVAEPKKEEPKKQMPPAYKTEVKHVDGENYIIHEVKSGETFFTISVLYNLKFDVIQAANPNVGDLIYEGDEIMVPIPTEVKFYFEFFDYNVKEIHTDNQEYQNFLTQVENVVKEAGSAKLMLEASSSKVPSARFGDNEKLSLQRAEAAKAALIASMGEKGIGSDKLNFVSVSTLVRGPEFNNDAQENRETYKNYQYVKVIVK